MGGLASGKVRGEECRLWSTLGQKAESGGGVEEEGREGYGRRVAEFVIDPVHAE